MGSGDRIKFYTVLDGVGLGLNVSRFPFSLTVHLQVLIWHLSVGFGKGYDE